MDKTPDTTTPGAVVRPCGLAFDKPMSIEIKRNGDLMADRKVTVVNAGYQEQLPDTIIAACCSTNCNTHAVNKLYVDTGLANLDLTDIEADISVRIRY